MFDNIQPRLSGTNTEDTSAQERFTVVSVRLRAAEFQEFSRQVRAFGLTNSMALRIAARRIGGFLEVEKETRQRLEETMQLIEHVSSNLARLADAFSADTAVNLAEFKQERRILSEALSRLESLLSQILNISLRRIDGRALLEATMGRKGSKE